MTKSTVTAIIHKIAENANAIDNGYNYEVKINDWTNYGKDRTYFSIIETCENSKHYREYKYGYFDNETGEYIEMNVFGGTYMMFSEDIISEETKKVAEIDKPVRKIAYCEVAGFNGSIDRVLGTVNIKFYGSNAYVSKADCDKIREQTNCEKIVLNLPSLGDDCYTVVEINGEIF